MHTLKFCTISQTNALEQKHTSHNNIIKNLSVLTEKTYLTNIHIGGVFE